MVNTTSEIKLFSRLLLGFHCKLFTPFFHECDWCRFRALGGRL